VVATSFEFPDLDIVLAAESEFQGAVVVCLTVMVNFGFDGNYIPAQTSFTIAVGLFNMYEEIELAGFASIPDGDEIQFVFLVVATQRVFS
jgi:hypothetical protein